MLNNLANREREVILLRFGFMGGNGMTFEEVGQHLGLTRQRVKQIESRAMRKLKHPLAVWASWSPHANPEPPQLQPQTQILPRAPTGDVLWRFVKLGRGLSFTQ